jgi:hypothetical protein
MGFGNWGGGPGPLGHLGQFVWAGLSALLALVLIGVAVALVVLLVRFLLVGTRAAQLYVANHTPAKDAGASPATTATPTAGPTPATAGPAPAAAPPAEPATPGTAGTSAAARTRPAAAKPPAAKPAPRPRTPKAPPA